VTHFIVFAPDVDNGALLRESAQHAYSVSPLASSQGG
jgi:hypothetical protein